MTLSFQTLDELPKVAKEIITIAGEQKVWLFNGEMGAGKTTLIKEICQQLGVEDEVSSPTYSIVNEYITINNKLIYHFDFYRIKSEDEAYDIGTDEYLDSGNLCLIEWSSLIPNLLPDNCFVIDIFIDIATSRRDVACNV